MTIELARDVLLWCLIVNYGVLLLWFLVFLFARSWMFKLHTRWFHLSGQGFDGIHYGGMAVYKIGILLLNLVPYVALCIARSGS
jgi:Family of unknown function (DUF6868)